jgi:type II secretory pathway component PulM
VAASADLADRANRVIGARIAAGEDLAGDAAMPLLQRVSRSLERAGLQGSLVTSQSDTPAAEQVELALRDAPFDDLVSTLGTLARNDGVTVTSVNIVRTGPGRERRCRSCCARSAGSSAFSSGFRHRSL